MKHGHEKLIFWLKGTWIFFNLAPLFDNTFNPLFSV